MKRKGLVEPIFPESWYAMALLGIFFLLVLPMPVAAGIAVTNGTPIRTWDGELGVVIEITDDPVVGGSTITLVTPFPDIIANWTGTGIFNMDNVDVTTDAAGATWSGEIDPSGAPNLILTSAGGNTDPGETITVNFTGAQGSPWWTGIPDCVLYDDLPVTRDDTGDPGSYDFEIQLTLGNLTVTDGDAVTTTTGETSSVITITDSPVPRDYTIDIDIADVHDLVASGAFTDDNVQISDTAAGATWTGAVNADTLTLTSGNGYTAVGETVTVTFTGAGGNPWITNSGGRKTLNLTATRIDTTTQTATIHFVIETAPPPGVSTANTAINGLTVTTVGDTQTVTVDTAVQPASLIPNNSVLEIRPPADRGLKNVSIYALDGAGFTRIGSLITGNPTSVHLVSADIAPAAGFSAGIGPSASFSYSFDNPTYPENMVLTTTIWQGPVDDYKGKVISIAAGNSPPASVLGTAYTARVTKTNFPANATVRINMSLDSDWQDEIGPMGGNSGTTFIWRIADDGNSGQILPTSILFTSAGANLDFFKADSPQGFSTFGISSFSGNNNPFQLVSLAVAQYSQSQDDNPDDAGSPASPDKGTGTGQPQQPNQPQPNQPQQLAPPATLETKSAELFSNDQGVVTQATVLEAADHLATLSIGQGVTALDAGGSPVSSVSLTETSIDNLPAASSAGTVSFAGMAYDLQPDGATFSPAITISFPAPAGTFGQEFSVKSFDTATNSWVDVPTTYNPQDGTVTATLSHFCTFALFAKTTTTPPQVARTMAAPPETSLNKPVTPQSQTPMETFVGIAFWGFNLVMKNPIIITTAVAIIIGMILFSRRRLKK